MTGIASVTVARLVVNVRLRRSSIMLKDNVPKYDTFSVFVSKNVELKTEYTMLYA